MSGRTVIVTGASSGIGEATARAFGRAGDRVVIAARRAELLERVAADLPESLVVPADLTRSDDIARLVEVTLKRYATVDVLVNNAGVAHYDWLEGLTEEEILNDIHVNLIAPVLLTRAVLPTMQARQRGVIINVNSVAGKIATPTMSIYNATKFGLDGFTECMRRELGPQGIHVCGVYPLGVDTPGFGGKRRVNMGITTPPWLRLSADEVARAIVSLADRPRARRVMPGFFGAVIATNALAPWIVDRFTMRAARRARRGER